MRFGAGGEGGVKGGGGGGADGEERWWLQVHQPVRMLLFTFCNINFSFIRSIFIWYLYSLYEPETILIPQSFLVFHRHYNIRYFG